MASYIYHSSVQRFRPSLSKQPIFTDRYLMLTKDMLYYSKYDP